MGLTLVTGASGFVGTHLVQEMRKRGLPVRGVSRQKRPGLVKIPTYGPEVDWTAYLADVDAVVHLAARVHVMRETAKDPLEEFRTANVDATLNLARQAASAGIRRFVFVSTIKVNGECTEPGKPFTTNDPPNPQDPYAISKAEAESALKVLGDETGMEIVIVRPPLVYGPGVGGNFRSLMKWAASGLPSILADVNNSRSMVFISNFCDMLLTALDHPKAAETIIFVSDGRALSTHEVLSALAAAYGQKKKSIRVPVPALVLIGRLLRRENAIRRLMGSLEADATSTYSRLDWSPPVDAVAALSATVRLDNLSSK